MTQNGLGAAEQPAREPAIELENLSFSYRPNEPVLAIQQWAVAAGETVFLKGPSGSGKSTLLGLIGGILTPDSGHIRVLGEDLASLSRGARDRFRAQHLGFIFQMFNLLPYLSLLENITLPCRFSRQRAGRAGEPGPEARARKLLEQLGLDPAIAARPVTELSVGQQQRVAAARALIGEPELLVADEPTSALDADSRTQFVELLLAQSKAAGSAVLFVSHDASLAPLFDRAEALTDLNSIGPSS